MRCWHREEFYSRASPIGFVPMEEGFYLWSKECSKEQNRDEGFSEDHFFGMGMEIYRLYRIFRLHGTLRYRMELQGSALPSTIMNKKFVHHLGECS